MKRFRWLLFSFILLLLAACSGGDGMVVDGVWGRTSPRMAQNGAFYMTITNDTGEDDVLQAVRTGVCDTVELHQTVIDDNGVMQMQPVEGQEIALPAGETVELKVGGLHVMCLGVTEPFELGQEIPLTLVFANAGEMDVTATIRDEAP